MTALSAAEPALPVSDRISLTTSPGTRVARSRASWATSAGSVCGGLDYFQAAGSYEVERPATGAVEQHERLFIENNRFQPGAQTVQARTLDGPHQRAVRNHLDRVHRDVHLAA